MNFQEQYDKYISILEPALSSCFGRTGFSYDGLLKSMDYSLMAGGKRIRPILTLEMSRVCGGDIEKTLPVACAVEMLHTYSLIHDDLPCMDNDDIRRGKPTNHVKFGECTAVLAGDALQAEAFGKILSCSLPDDRKVGCAGALAEAAGVSGICGGQFMDMNPKPTPMFEERLTEMQSRKTGSLIMAACRMGVIAAHGSEEQEDIAMEYGAALGSAFQIRDDMLDELSTPEELGKPVGSDRENHKMTFMTIYGEEKCEAMVQNLTRAAMASACRLPDGDFLCKLAEMLCMRKK